MSAADEPVVDPVSPAAVPKVEKLPSCGKMEVRERLDVVYAAMSELRSSLSCYCKGRSISFKPNDCSVRDMLILARTIVRSTD